MDKNVLRIYNNYSKLSFFAVYCQNMILIPIFTEEKQDNEEKPYKIQQPRCQQRGIKLPALRTAGY